MTQRKANVFELKFFALRVAAVLRWLTKIPSKAKE